MMRYLLIILSLLNVTVVSSQIPNNDFALWTNFSSYSTPDGWGNLNEYTNSGGVYTCMEATPGVSSTNYLILVTQNVPGKGVIAGKAISGEIDTTTFKPKNGFPFSSRPAQLNYIIQYMPWDFSDPSNIYVCLTRWDSLNNERDTIATGYSDFLGMAHSWFPGYTTLNYLDGNNPDTACIVISSSSVNPIAGGYLYIDDLNFSGNVIGVNEIQKQIDCSIYPNPANDYININVPNQNISELNNLEVYNSSGKLVHSTSFSANYSLNVGAWNSGIYLFRIKHGDFVSFKKISIR